MSPESSCTAAEIYGLTSKYVARYIRNGKGGHISFPLLKPFETLPSLAWRKGLSLRSGLE